MGLLVRAIVQAVVDNFDWKTFVLGREGERAGRPTFMLIVYTLANCDTCRAATKWLRSRAIPFEERAIRETPPTMQELRAALAANDGEVRKLFNVSGRDYREQKLGDKLAELSPAAALALLAGNGNLVKRPFLVGEGIALVGFDADRWAGAVREDV